MDSKIFNNKPNSIFFLFIYLLIFIRLVSGLHRYAETHTLCFSFFQNYEMFSEAVEADTVEQFLKIA